MSRYKTGLATSARYGVASKAVKAGKKIKVYSYKDGLATFIDGEKVFLEPAGTGCFSSACGAGKGQFAHLTHDHAYECFSVAGVTGRFANFGEYHHGRNGGRVEFYHLVKEDE